MEKMPIDVEELMRNMLSQEGFKPCGGLVISFSLLYQMMCGKSILFFKSGFLVKCRQLETR